MADSLPTHSEEETVQPESRERWMLAFYEERQANGALMPVTHVQGPYTSSQGMEVVSKSLADAMAEALEPMTKCCDGRCHRSIGAMVALGTYRRFTA